MTIKVKSAITSGLRQRPRNQHRARRLLIASVATVGLVASIATISVAAVDHSGKSSTTTGPSAPLPTPTSTTRWLVPHGETRAPVVPSSGGAAPGDGSFNAVSCPSATTCVAVGGDGGLNGVASTSKNAGSSWTQGTMEANEPELNAVDCSSVALCVAVGNGATVRSTDGGTTWSSHSIPTTNTSLLGVSCPSATLCVSVGVSPNANGPYIGQLLVSSDGGTSWTAPVLPDGVGALGSVDCPSVTFCVAVGASVLVSVDGGKTWTIRTVKGGTDALRSVSCSSATRCLAIGGNPAVAQDPGAAAFEVVTINGGATWSSFIMPAGSATLDVVACSSGANCQAAGSSLSGGAAPVLITSDGGASWSSPTSPFSSASAISAVSCSSSTTCVFVGRSWNQTRDHYEHERNSFTAKPSVCLRAYAEERIMRGSRVFGALDDRGRPFKFLRGVTRRSIFPIFAVLVVTAAFAPAITAGASTTRVNASPSRFYVGGIMRVGQRLSSPSHIFSAVLESDGQFEVLKHNTVVWRSSSGSGLNSVINRESNGDITITAPHESANVSGAKQNLKPSYLTVQNDGDMALVSKFGVTLWQSGLRAHTSGSTVTPYSRGALYGGSNPSVVCYTCEAADITGTAPPSDTLDSGTDVDNVTGDFSTSNSLFDAPSIGGDLSLSLGYDAELAQSDLQNGTAVGPFGVGWNSNYSDSITPGGDEYDNPTVTVNQGNGSQVTFTQSENYGESTFCQIAGQPTSSVFPGDYPTTNKYTLSSSDYQFCALDSVQGQLSEVTSSGYTYQQSGGQVIEDFGWTGQLEQVTTAAASSGTPSAGLVFYGASAGQSLIDGVTVTNACPTSATYGCTVIYNSDHSDIVEVKNIGGQIGEVIDPSGSIYTLTYDSDKNLVSIATPNPSGSSTASAWTYVYTESAGNPDTSDLEEIYDPDAVSPSGFVSGAAHSTSITYDDYSTTTPGMVSSLTDGTGATTTYSYSEECSTGDCVAAGQSQTTTITYPGEVPCPSGASGCTPTAQSPVEIDQYSGGLETSTSLGSSTNADENETWSYSWNLGNGVANSSEVITYPATLNVANNSAYVPPSATIISDPAGNVDLHHERSRRRVDLGLQRPRRQQPSRASLELPWPVEQRRNQSTFRGVGLHVQLVRPSVDRYRSLGQRHHVCVLPELLAALLRRPAEFERLDGHASRLFE